MDTTEEKLENICSELETIGEASWNIGEFLEKSEYTFGKIEQSLNKIANALAYSPSSQIMSISESNVLINDKLEELNSIVNDLSEKIDMTTGTAKWIVKPDVSEKSHCSERYYCSKCGDWNSYGKTNYCMNCGAKMTNAEI